MAGNGEAVLVPQLLSLWQQGLCGSVRILGDLLLANSASLGVREKPDWQLRTLLAYADSLQEDMQYRRALHYYKEALKVLEQIAHTGYKEFQEPLPTQGEVKWLMYKCYMQLKESQEALDILSSIPLKQRDAKVAVALGKLYHHFKNDNKCALICYKQAVSMCPLALDAVLGLLTLGMSLPEVVAVSASKAPPPPNQGNPLTTVGWLAGWLEAQARVAQCDFAGAVTGFERLTKTGFNLSPESSCQLGWCMAKLGKKPASEELFTMAQLKDPFVLKHMDTHARILSLKKLEQLSSVLLFASPLHPEPWVAKAWHQTRSKDIPPTERGKASYFVEKARSIDPKSPEAAYLQASLCFAKQELHSAIQKYSEAVRFDPTFFDAYEALIRCYLVVKSDKEAINLARMAAKHITRPAQQHYLEGIALSQRPSTLSKSKLSLEKAIRADKTFEKAIVALSNTYIHEGNTERAVELLFKHTESYSSPVLHTELGSCLVRLKRYQEAMDQYRLALCQDSNFEKALHGIEHLQKLNSSDLEEGGSVGAGSELEDEGEDILAAGSLEEALEMDSDDSIPVMDLANQEYQW